MYDRGLRKLHPHVVVAGIERLTDNVRRGVKKRKNCSAKNRKDEYFVNHTISSPMIL